MTVSAGDFYSLFWLNLLMKGLKACITYRRDHCHGSRRHKTDIYIKHSLEDFFHFQADFHGKTRKQDINVCGNPVTVYSKFPFFSPAFL